jgi:hypothetical protein
MTTPPAGGQPEARARAINAEPWEPLPGMIKLRCRDCGYWFAAPAAGAKRCPDCARSRNVQFPPEPAENG